ncbi:MAG: NAD(P)/FAD-dependent oxidoreductase [Anaerolineae bacterium]|nr:NAD(P)/FAD-dependent oxidoreductase [Anaerolineae bacterium]
MTSQPRPQIVIVGAGFGGLFAARTLANQAVDVILIDRHNYHTFTPLLYQVATAGLDPGEIAYPVRAIFRHTPNVRTLMGEVEAIDTAGRRAIVQASGETRAIPYDYLILAAGSVTHYFGLAAVAEHSLGLKDLPEAVALRNHILRQFEQAAWSDDPASRAAATTLVVVGGGPTGLETAGALHELVSRILEQEYSRLERPITPQVILVEAADHLLASYPAPLRQAALDQLRSLGVEVVLGDPVVEASSDMIRLKSGRAIPTRTLIWSAGVKASPLAAALGVPLAPGGRVPVRPTLEVPDLPGVYVVGDMAQVEDEHGPYPMVIPVAKQQGILAARNILRQIRGEQPQPFRYRDRGMMATIGRSRAVAWLYNRIPLRGYVAWLAWLVLHLLWLMGFRNRLNVLVNWVWNYFTYDRAVRIILEHHRTGRALPSRRTPIIAEKQAVEETETQRVI